MAKLRCERCEMTAAPKWSWVWYFKQFDNKGATDERTPYVELWLCPECAGEFHSDRARDAFLRKAFNERGGSK